MKTGICTWSLMGFPIESPRDMVDYAAQYGFQTIDLSLGGYQRFFDWMKQPLKHVIEHFTAFRAYADRRGIEISQTHAPYAVFPKFLGKDFMKSQYRSILITHLVGARYMVIHPIAFPLYGLKPLDREELDYNLRFFKKLTPHLRRHQVQAAVENIFDRDQGNIRNIHVSQPEGIAEYLSLLPEEHYVFCLDTGHLNIAGKAPRDAITLLGKRLKVLHVHDNDGISDQHILPGQGSIDWADFTASLAKVGFDGAMSLEIKPELSFFPEAKNISEHLISEVLRQRQD